ncbi:MAG TPA: AraC family transcriptional regulator [Gemmatimonadales bacterium]|nr:AraC family transcriptional regulator [Gemmatimonadales bacterium]
MGQRIVPLTMGSPRFRSAELEGFRVTQAEFAPHDLLAPHVHDRTVVAVMLQGSFDLEIRGSGRPCRPGTVLVEPCGERHANRLGNAGAMVVAIEPTPLYEREDLGPCQALLGAPTTFSCPPAASLASRLAKELHSKDRLSDVIVEDLVLRLLDGAAHGVERPAISRVPAWLQRARDLVHHSPLRPLRVRDVAADVGVHPVYLTKMFRERFGVSLGSYQRQRRLAWAADRLEAGASVAETALAAGFADQAHFTRAFKRYSGRTPARYRAAVAGETPASLR